MCSTWLINGVYCTGGDDLIRAIGVEAAKQVNAYYEMVGDTGYSINPNGERVPHTITEDHVLEGCLCHVDRIRLKELTGLDWEYDEAEDAFVARPSPL
jgi:hypothetical protein